MDWAQEVTDFDGEPVVEERIVGGRVVAKIADGKPVMLTLGRACINALITEFADENQTGGQKFDRTVLAMKIHEGQDLTAEDVALIKARVGKQYRADVVYRIWQMLESK